MDGWTVSARIGFWAWTLAVVLMLSGGSAKSGDEIPPALAIVVDFKGMEPSKNLILLLTRLYEKFGDKLIRSRPIEIQKGDTLCAILVARYQLHGCPGDLADLLGRKLNPGGSMLQIGKSYFIPDVRVESFPYTTHIDSSSYSKEQGRPGILKDPAWSSVTLGKIVDDDKAATGIVQLEGKRLTIQPINPVEVSAFFESILGLGLQDTSVYVASGRVGDRVLHANFSGIEEKAKECRTDPKNLSQNEGAYWKMLGSLSKWQPPACAMTCPAGTVCPQVVLVDTVVHPHPDLGVVRYLDGANNVRDYTENQDCSGPMLGSENQNYCEITKFVRTCHHGTSMASIISDRPNGYGFVGLAPATSLFSVDWLSTLWPTMLDFLEKRQGRDNFQDNGPQIYVFASIFPDSSQAESNDVPLDQIRSYPVSLMSGGELKQKESRSTHPLVQKIGETQDFWIVAAGQPATNDQGKFIGHPVRLHERAPIAPMNLGDFPNVIVVTACDPCEGSDRKPWEWANFSDQASYVNLAAPGLGYVTPANRGLYADLHGGTSQAAAFVAGVASSMVSCDLSDHGQTHDYRYVDNENGRVLAARLKRRLLLTSTPIRQPPENDRIITGIVNPMLALKDPRYDWLLPRGQETDSAYRQTTVQNWCEGAKLVFDKLDADGQIISADKDVSPGNTRRIRAEGEGNSRQWHIYTVDPNPLDPTVNVVGPVKFRNPRQEQLLVKTDEKVLKLNDFDDLVLSVESMSIKDNCKDAITQN